ncbi:hypothetical protein [Granulicella aggregans]|uniref:hypothetical protein n=1 Tax=Granulicella aggregans TaxID=474949 RepID=UPI0021DFD3AE|nr:hypothetical protein [Granulicella aggregans]
MDGLELVDGDHAGAFGAGERGDAVELELGGAAEAVDVDDVLVLWGVATSVLVLVGDDLALGTVIQPSWPLWVWMAVFWPGDQQMVMTSKRSSR